jgi:hypothetical protein
MEQGLFQNSLSDLKSTKSIQNLTNSDLFDNLLFNDKSKELLDKLKQNYSDFYYISVFPNEIDKYRWNEIIYNIFKQYKHTAENRNLELLILKYSDETVFKARKNIKKLQEQYWDIISGDIINYSFIVWFLWGSAWRKWKEIINEIRKNIDVKDLTIK